MHSMSRVSIAQRTRLSMHFARRSLRKIAGRLKGHQLLRWDLVPGKTDRLVIAPQDLRTADPTRASEIYAGRFAFAGRIVVCDGRSPFEMTPPSEEWAEHLFGFGWLRHLRAAESGITRANARALVDEWISLQGSSGATGWRPDVVARRITSWLSQAPLILHDADMPFYRRFLRSLTRQMHYLRNTANEAQEGIPRLEAMIALTFGTLCMASQMRHLRGNVRRLAAELDRQILPDGGHISRNPGALVDLLLDLLPLRQAFTARNVIPPPALLNAIDRMMPMLRFFRHADGSFAHFNGMGPTPPDLLATVLAYDDARGAPFANAPHSGYQRLAANDLLLLMDTGAPPPIIVSQNAHAGALSFELSAKQQRIVVNCGLPVSGRENWRQVARATAAHSTVTISDTSSCRFVESGSFRRMLGSTVVSGPTHVPVARDENEDDLVLRASHDGYADGFGIVHQRTVLLARNGARLQGEDMFLPASGNALPSNGRDAFAVRFHLHPSVKASGVNDGQGVMLVLADRDVWSFTAGGAPVALEESVYLGGTDGPRRTIQIVIYGNARETPQVNWNFSRSPPGAATSRRRSGEAPELPLG
jgi:uncharacterized heparinase superfamily protein